MKKMFCILLAALLLLTGCQASVSETTEPSEMTAAPKSTTALAPSVASPTEPNLVIRDPSAGDIAFENPGKARIAYTGTRSYVKYITSVEELPEEEALAGYDAAFFENNALLIVVETATSGSVQLEIGGIYLDGDTATVKLNRSMPGEFGTADMATWMLWVELEQGLEYSWMLENASQLPQGEKY